MKRLTNRELRKLVATRDGWECSYCGQALLDGADQSGPYIRHYPPDQGGGYSAMLGYKFAELDHVDPTPCHWSHRDRLENLVLACNTCNATKGARSVEWFLQYMGWAS